MDAIEYSELTNREMEAWEAEVRSHAARVGVDPDDFETIQDCDLYMQHHGL